MVRHATPPVASLSLEKSVLARRCHFSLDLLRLTFLRSGPIPEFGFGLAGAVTRRSSTLQPNTPAGELQWGGVAGTHWAISPATDEVLVLMTQRHMGFWNPFWFEWKAAAYAALNSARKTA